ncbi:unnamed protein product [Rotaria magnacalcarata]|uniref:Uncharacterized protein n=1 Tax=Rotaria magnacalcarata TaxID=392030 RepID=A0A816T3U9_9BILA|nr:unnamed protein product [Rotaria magnacalcarata]CAF1671471.1 unnamed protein product [Rotaria magnacalcarata]CAF2079398.1 unnamed protein product [Rotaria magnacalcarata]CAF2092367.1 unnamed protein product [Rotaria magnacalcarata]CAF2167829.1 unnamed protein product [Rotaria magnacalcarata]
MSIHPSNIDPCDLRSHKFSVLLSKPLGNKMLYKLPGIGKRTFKKLEKTKQIAKAEDLLREFIHIFQRDHQEFRLWLIKDYALPEYRATECVIALIDYIEQAKRNQWVLP